MDTLDKIAKMLFGLLCIGLAVMVVYGLHACSMMQSI